MTPWFLKRGGVLIWEGKPLNKEHKLFVGNYADNIKKIRLEIPEAGFSENDTISQGTEKLIRWCEKEFNKEIIDNLDQKHQSKIDRYCFGNVETVKEKLSAAGIVNWLKSSNEETEDDNKFKYLVAIYVSNSEFQTWTSIQSTEKPSEGYTKLKNKCEEELKKPLKDYPVNNYKYLSWWCTEVTPLTIEGRIKKQNPSWEKESDNSKWSEIFNNWKYTTEVLDAFKNVNFQYKSLTSSSQGSSGKDAVQKFCEKGLVKNIHEDDVYKNEYQKIMSVCKKK